MGKIAEAFKAAKDVLKGDDQNKVEKEKAFVEFVKRAAIDKEVTCMIICDSISDLNICYPSDVVKDMAEYYYQLKEGDGDTKNHLERAECTFKDILEYIILGVWQKDTRDDGKFVKRIIVPEVDYAYWIKTDDNFRQFEVYYDKLGDRPETLYGSVYFDPTKFYPIALFTFISCVDPMTHDKSIKTVEIQRFDNFAPFAVQLPTDEEYVVEELDINADVYEIEWNKLIPEPLYGKDFINEIIRGIKDKLINEIRENIRSHKSYF